MGNRVIALVAALLLFGPMATPVAADRSGSTTNDEIARLYLGIFGRAPDLGGEVYWNHRANDGTPAYSIAIYSVGWSSGPLAARSNDQPAYVTEADDHMNHIAEHIARMMTR